ncbi:UNVERIFIED_CONTAM: hypothetical protein FKN15_051951 [Acipenser sinensis]
MVLLETSGLLRQRPDFNICSRHPIITPGEKRWSHEAQGGRQPSPWLQQVYRLTPEGNG